MQFTLLKPFVIRYQVIIGILISQCLTGNSQMILDSCINGTAGPYPCHNIDLIKSISRAEILPNAIYDMGIKIYDPDRDYGNDIWGWTDEISGREFILSGRMSGTSFIEITNPSQPIFVGYLFGGDNNPRTRNIWRDMKTQYHYAYIVSEDHNNGIQVFDLKRLLEVQSPPVIFEADTIVRITQTSGTPGSAHNIVASEGNTFMYAVGGASNGCNGGLEFFDITNPVSPVYRGCYNAEGYTHDAVCFDYHGPDVEHIGEEICVASNADYQVVINMENKADVTTLSSTYYANKGYTHQGWVTDDHRFVLFNDELDEMRFGQNTRTHVMNIEDLDSSYYMGYVELSTISTDHNCYVKGQYLYEANYKSGLRILDLKNIHNFPDSMMEEVAFMEFDPHKRSEVWSVYPYFKSGVIAVNTIYGDVVLVYPRLPHFVLHANENIADVCAGDTIEYKIQNKSYYGYNDLTDFGISGLPDGVISILSPSSVVPNDSILIKLIIPKSLIGGQFSFDLTGHAQNGPQMNKISLAFRISSIPDDIFIEDETISNNRILRAANSISLDGMTLSAGKKLSIYAPQIEMNDIRTENDAILELTNEKNCRKL